MASLLADRAALLAALSSMAMPERRRNKHGCRCGGVHETLDPREPGVVRCAYCGCVLQIVVQLPRSALSCSGT